MSQDSGPTGSGRTEAERNSEPGVAANRVMISILITELGGRGPVLQVTSFSSQSMFPRGGPPASDLPDHYQVGTPL